MSIHSPIKNFCSSAGTSNFKIIHHDVINIFPFNQNSKSQLPHINSMSDKSQARSRLNSLDVTVQNRSRLNSLINQSLYKLSTNSTDKYFHRPRGRNSSEKRPSSICEDARFSSNMISVTPVRSGEFQILIDRSVASRNNSIMMQSKGSIETIDEIEQPFENDTIQLNVRLEEANSNVSKISYIFFLQQILSSILAIYLFCYLSGFLLATLETKKTKHFIKEKNLLYSKLILHLNNNEILMQHLDRFAELNGFANVYENLNSSVFFILNSISCVGGPKMPFNPNVEYAYTLLMFFGVPLFVYCSYHYSSGIISFILKCFYKFIWNFGIESDYEHSSDLQKFILSLSTNLLTLLLCSLYYCIQFQSSFGENFIYLLLNCWTINEGFFDGVLQGNQPSIFDQILIVHFNLFSVGNHLIVLQLVVDYVNTNQNIIVENVKCGMSRMNIVPAVLN